MAKKIKLEQPKPTFDPSKSYQWQSNTEITMTGAEFEVINRALTRFMQGSVTDMNNILGLVLAANVIQAKIAEYVEKGVMTEYVPAKMEPERAD